MVRIAVVFFLCLSLFTQVWGQDDFQLGITAGPQISWPVAPERGLERTGSYLGYYYGVQLDLFIADNYSFCTGLFLSQVGGKVEFADSVRFGSTDIAYSGGTELFIRNQYLEVPFTVRLLSNQVGELRYFAQFGVQGGVRIRSRGDLSSTAFSESKLNFSKDVSLFNMGLVIGGGIEHELPGVTSAQVGLQFSNGFVNVLSLPEDFKQKARQNFLRLLLVINF
ncbi:MAG: PorT family protein [Chitinophagales bacterium]|nr:PorT family protein [Chitinophagales bacterium]MDW8428816.1 porin family protein [Chitinophagales bacterium]